MAVANNVEGATGRSNHDGIIIGNGDGGSLREDLWYMGAPKKNANKKVQAIEIRDKSVE